MSVSKQAVVFLTHRQDDTVLRHFVRLRAETKGVLATFLCVHDLSDTTRLANLPADFRVDMEEAARVLPARYEAFRSGPNRLNLGFPDLLYMPVLLRSELTGYDFVWLLEYDVDYVGNWEDFFSRTMESSADLLGTTIFSREQSARWLHWLWFRAPPEAPVDVHLRSFMPIVRFSRRMLDLYVDTVRDARWQGHTEALYPTIARHSGLLIHDLGGTGPYCPPAWLAKNYSNNPQRINLTPGTFVFRPARSDKYYHEAPERFAERDFLYHPIKPTMAQP